MTLSDIRSPRSCQRHEQPSCHRVYCFALYPSTKSVSISLSLSTKMQCLLLPSIQERQTTWAFGNTLVPLHNLWEVKKISTGGLKEITSLGNKCPKKMSDMVCTRSTVLWCIIGCTGACSNIIPSLMKSTSKRPHMSPASLRSMRHSDSVHVHARN